MVDRIRFDPPLGPLGRVVKGFALGRHLQKLIEERGHGLKVEAERRA